MAIKKFGVDFSNDDIKSIFDNNIKLLEAEQERQLAEIDEHIALLDKFLKSKDKNEMAELKEKIKVYEEIDERRKIEERIRLEKKKNFDDYSFELAYESYRTRHIGKKELAQELNISVRKLNKILEEKGLK